MGATNSPGTEPLPAPLVPPEVDLRGLEYMPLFGQRLLDSDLNAHANDGEWRAAVTLYWAAWTQRPAASLPDDDVALARLADLGRDADAWRRVKERALHGFILCADGRLYHPFLAEQAKVAWEKRVREREKKRRWREAQHRNPTVDETGTRPGQDRSGARDVPVEVKGSEAKGQEKQKSIVAPSTRVLDANIPTARLNGYDNDDPIVVTIPLCSGEFGVTKSLRDELDQLYPAVDPDQTLREIRGWNLANEKRRKTARGIRRHIFDWFKTEQDKQSRRAS